MLVTMTTRPAALALAIASVLAFALLSALFTPRGPVTAQQALVTMVVALAVGLIVAALTGSRWTLVQAPAAFVAVLELARLGAWGPTVDAPASFGLLHVLAFSPVGRPTASWPWGRWCSGDWSASPWLHGSVSRSRHR
jgi:hypothetical protein